MVDTNRGNSPPTEDELKKKIEDCKASIESYKAQLASLEISDFAMRLNNILDAHHVPRSRAGAQQVDDALTEYDQLHLGQAQDLARAMTAGAGPVEVQKPKTSGKQEQAPTQPEPIAGNEAAQPADAMSEFENLLNAVDNAPAQSSTPSAMEQAKERLAHKKKESKRPTAGTGASYDDPASKPWQDDTQPSLADIMKQAQQAPPQAEVAAPEPEPEKPQEDTEEEPHGDLLDLLNDYDGEGEKEEAPEQSHAIQPSETEEDEDTLDLGEEPAQEEKKEDDSSNDLLDLLHQSDDEQEAEPESESESEEPESESVSESESKQPEDDWSIFAGLSDDPVDHQDSVSEMPADDDGAESDTEDEPEAKPADSAAADLFSEDDELIASDSTSEEAGAEPQASAAEEEEPAKPTAYDEFLSMVAQLKAEGTLPEATPDSDELQPKYTPEKQEDDEDEKESEAPKDDTNDDLFSKDDGLDLTDASKAPDQDAPEDSDEELIKDAEEEKAAEPEQDSESDANPENASDLLDLLESAKEPEEKPEAPANDDLFADDGDDLGGVKEEEDKSQESEAKAEDDEDDEFKAFAENDTSEDKAEGDDFKAVESDDAKTTTESTEPEAKADDTDSESLPNPDAETEPESDTDIEDQKKSEEDNSEDLLSLLDAMPAEGEDENKAANDDLFAEPDDIGGEAEEGKEPDQTESEPEPCEAEEERKDLEPEAEEPAAESEAEPEDEAEEQNEEDPEQSKMPVSDDAKAESEPESEGSEEESKEQPCEDAAKDEDEIESEDEETEPETAAESDDGRTAEVADRLSELMELSEKTRQEAEQKENGDLFEEDDVTKQANSEEAKANNDLFADEDADMIPAKQEAADAPSETETDSEAEPVTEQSEAHAEAPVEAEAIIKQEKEPKETETEKPKQLSETEHPGVKVEVKQKFSLFGFLRKKDKKPKRSVALPNAKPAAPVEEAKSEDQAELKEEKPEVKQAEPEVKQEEASAPEKVETPKQESKDDALTVQEVMDQFNAGVTEDEEAPTGTPADMGEKELPEGKVPLELQPNTQPDPRPEASDAPGNPPADFDLEVSRDDDFDHPDDGSDFDLKDEEDLDDMQKAVIAFADKVEKAAPANDVVAKLKKNPSVVTAERILAKAVYAAAQELDLKSDYEGLFMISKPIDFAKDSRKNRDAKASKMLAALDANVNRKNTPKAMKYMDDFKIFPTFIQQYAITLLSSDIKKI